MTRPIHRFTALVCLLGASFLFFKLARFSNPATHHTVIIPNQSNSSYQSDKNQLLQKYSPTDSELVRRVLDKYAQTAIKLDKTDGLRGLKLLDLLDLEAVYLYETHPRDFRRLCELVDDQAAAKILLTWRDYLSLKRADDIDRTLWIAELERLSPSQRALVQKNPEVLPLIMSEPEAVSELIERMADHGDDLRDSLVALQLVSLREGPRSIRKVIDTLDKHPKWALEALRRRGPEGLLVVSLFGDVFENLNNEAILDDSIVALHVACEDANDYLRSHSPNSLASHLRHLASVGLLTKVSDHPQALRLTLDYGSPAESAIRSSGADAAEVVYANFSDDALRRQAVAAMADHGMTAAIVLEKYATDTEFREILRRHGAAIIQPIAQSDLSPELVAKLREKSDRSTAEMLALGVMSLAGDSGQATIHMIYEDGMDRISQVQRTSISAVEFLPLYDLTHLANVLRKGYTPTSGEWTWALMDGAFVVADVLSLTALQPGAAAASELTRGQVKTIGRTALRESTETLTETTAKIGLDTGALATRRAGQWLTVRTAGGLGRVIRQMPLAIEKMSLSQVEQLVRPLATRAGMNLSRFEPLRFLKNGREVIMRIPPERGLKYLAIESGQAAVGLSAYWKMEEHLASRRSDMSDMLTH